MRRIAILSTCVIVLGLTATNAKGEKTNEAKTTEAVASPTESNSAANLVWYPVTYDASHPSGYIPSGTSSVFTGDQAGAQNLNICPTGSTIDCLRGFASAPSLPSTNSGNEQVKTDDQD